MIKFIIDQLVSYLLDHSFETFRLRSEMPSLGFLYSPRFWKVILLSK